MITEWLLQLGIGLWAMLADLFPDWEAPPEVLDADGMVAGLFELGDGIEPWVNWGLLGLLAAIPFAVWVVGVLVKAAKSLISHVPFIGGNG